jgi:hypothetical protein
MRKIFIALALAATMVLGTAATALAFEPPADPADKFEVFACDGPGIIGGHPGAKGQFRAIGPVGERTVGAWNATDDLGSNSGGHSQVVVGGGCT